MRPSGLVSTQAPLADRPGTATCRLRVFLNYRRDDSADATGRLYDALAAHFGDDNVFMDIDTLDPGVDFAEVIDGAVNSCDVFIAVIGRAWLTAADGEGHRRLDNADDFVRMELTAALRRNARVVPVLVHDVDMPSAEELPDDLTPLTRRNAVSLSRERWSYDVSRLVRTLDTVAEELDGGAAANGSGTVDAAPKRRRLPSLGRVPLAIGAVVAVALVGALVAMLGGGASSQSGPAVPRRVGTPIPVQAQPDSIAVGLGGVWVTSLSNDSVSKLDLTRGTAVGKPAKVGNTPTGVAVGYGAVWVSNADGTVAKVDARSLKVRAGPTKVGKQLANVASGFGSIWAADFGSNTVVRIDPRTNRRLATIHVGTQPTEVAVGMGSVWVTNAGDGTLSRINPATNQLSAASTPVGDQPAHLAVGEGSVWVANIRKDTVTKVDPTTGSIAGSPIHVGSRPDGLAVAGHAVWVVCQDADTVVGIDPKSGKTSRPVTVGNAPAGIAADSARRLWVINRDSENVTRLAL